LSYLRPNFYTYNVEIWLKRTDLGNIKKSLNDTKFPKDHLRDCMACRYYIATDLLQIRISKASSLVCFH